MFASKTPRDLNPHSVIMTGAGTPPLCTCGWQGRRFDGPILAEHIAEFDHVQHDEPNPILVTFRRRADDETLDFWICGLDALAAFGGWTEWDSPRHPLHSLTLATDEQIDHARRVLTRLANLSRIGDNT